MKNSQFYFLEKIAPEMERVCEKMEQHIPENPQEAILKGRLFCEMVVEAVAKQENLEYIMSMRQQQRIIELEEHGVVDDYIRRALDDIRYIGNKAAHTELASSLELALRVHRRSYEIAKWYYESYGDDPLFIPETYRDIKITHRTSELQDEIYDLIKNTLQNIVITEANSISFSNLQPEVEKMNIEELSPEVNINKSKEADTAINELMNYEYQKMEGSYLLHELSKLRDSAKHAVEGTNTLSELKRYLHVEREIQKEFIEALKLASKESSAQLIMLCGSVGDGKSHLLSYVRSDFPELVNGFAVHNDATESFNPDKNSIDTLAEVLEPFRDELIETSGAKCILAINLGILNNFLESEYAQEGYQVLRKMIQEADVFNTESILDHYHKEHVTIISFSDFNLYELDENCVESSYISNLFAKIAAKDSRNFFYKAYRKDKGGKLNHPVVINYELFQEEEVRNRLVQLLIRAMVEYKKIISTRELLNFVYEILVPDVPREIDDSLRRTDYLGELLPNLVFCSMDGSDLLQVIQRMDPVYVRNESLDQLQIDCNIADSISGVVENYMDCSKINFLNDCIQEVNSLYELQEEVRKLLMDTIIRYTYFFGKNNEELFYKDTYENYLRYLYYYNINRPRKYKELFEEVRKAIFLWKGSYKENYICVEELGNRFRISEELKLKPEVMCNDETREEIKNRFKQNIVLKIRANDKLEERLVIDYPLYEMIVKINHGYCPNKNDRENLIVFDEFIDRLINNGHSGKEIYVQELKEGCVFRLELDDSYGEVYYTFERLS